jgi:hypothetical protein
MSSSEALTMKPFLGAVTTTVLLLAWIVFMAGSSTAEKVNRLPRQSGGGMNKPGKLIKLIIVTHLNCTDCRAPAKRRS